MDFDDRVRAVRSFNRFYTKRLGLLQQGMVGSPFSLAEGRVLYELAHRDRPTASDLGKALDLDAGYLSRLLRGFGRRGLVAASALRGGPPSASPPADRDRPTGIRHTR
jgi:DNA-binding MarR family transcriptional regulator